jgi:putative inorganic carbon (hco3(-)) transporter
MRLILLLLVVVMIAFAALFKPRVGLFGYIWFALMRPDVIAWSRGDFAFSMYLAIALLVGSSAQYLLKALETWFQNPFCRLLILLQVPILISYFGAVHPQYASAPYNQLIRMVVISLWIPVLIQTIDDMRVLFLVTAVALGSWGFWNALMSVLRGGVYISEGIGGMMPENNTMAIGLAMVLPICWYGRLNLPLKWQWMYFPLVAMTFGCIGTIILTLSRAASLALGVVLGLIAMRSKHRVIVLLVLLAVSAAVTGLIFDRYTARMNTLRDIEGEASANSRIVQIKAAWGMWKDHPWFGIGQGDMTYIELSQRYLGGERGHNIVHNSYMQMLVHCGVFAFLIYTGMFVYALMWTARSAKRLRKTHPDLAAYPYALQISLVAFMLTSLAHPRAFFDFSYMVLMYVAAWYGIEQRLNAAEPQATAAVPAPWPANRYSAQAGFNVRPM